MEQKFILLNLNFHSLCNLNVSVQLIFAFSLNCKLSAFCESIPEEWETRNLAIEVWPSHECQTKACLHNLGQGDAFSIICSFESSTTVLLKLKPLASRIFAENIQSYGRSWVKSNFQNHSVLLALKTLYIKHLN